MEFVFDFIQRSTSVSYRVVASCHNVIHSPVVLASAVPMLSFPFPSCAGYGPSVNIGFIFPEIFLLSFPTSLHDGFPVILFFDLVPIFKFFRSSSSFRVSLFC